MVGHGVSSAGSYLADPTSPIPSHCASIVSSSTLRVNDRYTSNVMDGKPSVLPTMLSLFIIVYCYTVKEYTVLNVMELKPYYYLVFVLLIQTMLIGHSDTF